MKQSAPRVRYAGFSLLEVLVALVILSVGLLGLARMQSTGLRQNNSAYFHSQATTLAYAILDRIRVNLDAAENRLRHRHWNAAHGLKGLRNSIKYMFHHGNGGLRRQ